MATHSAPHRTSLALAAAVVLLALAAEARGVGGAPDLNFGWATGALIGGGLAVTAVAATNVTFSIYDLWALGAEREPSVGIGVAELLLMPPQVAIGLFGLVAAHDPTIKVLAGALALWTGALLVHGLYTLVTGTGTPPARGAARAGSAPRVDVSPTVMLTTGSTLAPAVSLSVRL